MAPLPLLLALVSAQDAPPLTPPDVLFAAEVIDHRRSQSPVKDQGRRGTCAAFALCGALETFPGVPTDLNEQLLYATTKLFEQDVDTWLRQVGGELLLDEGNALREYLPLFELVGTCHERVWPYDPNQVIAGPDVPEDIRRFTELARIGPDELRGLRDAVGKYGFRAADVEVLEGAAAQDVARLQAALRSGLLAIPVGYAVHGGNWSALGEVGLAALDGEPSDGPRVIVHPGMLEHFAPRPAEGEPAWLSYADARAACRAGGLDLPVEVHAGRWVSGAHSEADAYGGHAVLIVGCDARGFLVKNSWGPDWGDGGYCVVSFDYHRLYAHSALLLRAAQLRNPVLNPFEASQRVRDGRYRVKVQPRTGPLGATLHVSTWMEDPRDAGFEVAEYTLEVRSADGAWATLASTAVAAGPPDARTGAPWELGGLTTAALAGAAEARLRVRYGVDVLAPSDLRGARFVAERTFAGFPTQPASALDLVPE